jgi:hypothetical protein
MTETGLACWDIDTDENDVARWEHSSEKNGSSVGPLSVGLSKIGISPFTVTKYDSDSEEDDEGRVIVRELAIAPSYDRYAEIFEIVEIKERHRRGYITATGGDFMTAILELTRYAMPAITAALGAISMFFTVIFFTGGVISLGIVGVFGSTTFLLISVVSFRLQRKIDRREWRQRNHEIIYQ